MADESHFFKIQFDMYRIKFWGVFLRAIIG
jgi:hypothetical protein